MRRFFNRLANLFFKSSAEREMEREIASNLALQQEEYERRGLSPEEAVLAARRAHGSLDIAKELHRDARGFPGLEQFFNDMFYSARNLIRAPGFALLAILAVALGVGVNATIFGLYNGVMLKPLPIADPARVFRVERWFERGSHGAMQFNFAWPEYEYLRAHASSFDGVTASTDVVALVSPDAQGYGEPFPGQAVSDNFFADLGVRPMLGRPFQPNEEAVVVLGFRAWARTFHRDPNVLGRTVKLNGIPVKILGVMPEQFRGTALTPVPTAFWAPLTMLEQLDTSFTKGWRDQWRDASHSGFELLARVRKGASYEAAQAEVNVLMRQFLSGRRETDVTKSITLRRTAYWAVSEGNIDFEIRALIAVMLALVLLVACANVANMLLARGMARRREIGIRLAVGASRGRVVRQLLMESFLLAVAGGAVGVAVSAWSGRLLWASIAGTLQGLLGWATFDLDVSPDERVFVFAALLATITAVLFGLAPAIATTRPEVDAALRPRRGRLRGMLLAAQVAAVVVLLSITGGLASNLRKSITANIGFDARDIYLAMFVYSSDAVDPRTVNRQLRARLAGLGGVDSVTVGDVPLWNGKGQTIEAGGVKHHALVSYGSGAYFETLRLPISLGRTFTQAEAERDGPVAVVSEFTANLYWPHQDPIGQRFFLGQDNREEFAVVGVAPNVRFNDLTEPDEAHVYLPSMDKHSGGLFFRTRGDRQKTLETVRSEIASLDPHLLPALVLVSLEDGPFKIQRSFFQLLAVFTGALTVFCLTLAAIGIYGVMSFLVSQRTKEIGIRMALGARAGEVIRGIAARGFPPVLAGMAVGFAVAGGLGAWFESMEKEFPEPLLKQFFADPAGYVELVIMLLVAALAAVAPARRATRVDPVIALRHE
jgi:predicted permease